MRTRIAPDFVAIAPIVLAPPFDGLLADEGDDVDGAPGPAAVCFQNFLLMSTVLNFLCWGVDEAWLPQPNGTRLGRAGVAGDGAAPSGGFVVDFSDVVALEEGAGAAAGASVVAGALMSSPWTADVGSFDGAVTRAGSLFAAAVDGLVTGAWVSVLAIDASDDAS